VQLIIPCECGISYTSETGRPLVVQLHEHRYNLQQGFLEKSKYAQYAYEEGQRIGWDDTRILENESNSRYRKYKESTHMACLTNPANPVSTFLLSGSLSSAMRFLIRREDLYDVTDSSWGFIKVSVSSVQVLLHRCLWTSVLPPTLG
jgi:hypothetical protein